MSDGTLRALALLLAMKPKHPRIWLCPNCDNAPRGERNEGLSRLRGNSHEWFLGEHEGGDALCLPDLEGLRVATPSCPLGN